MLSEVKLSEVNDDLKPGIAGSAGKGTWFNESPPIRRMNDENGTGGPHLLVANNP